MFPERDGLHGVHREARTFALPRGAVNAVLASLLVEALGEETRPSSEAPKARGQTDLFAVESRSLFGRVRLCAKTEPRDEGDLSVEVTAENLDSPLVLLLALAFSVATAGAGLLVLAFFSGALAQERTRRRAALVHAVFEALEAMEREPLGSYRTSAYALRD